jgi:hypothetical protein
MTLSDLSSIVGVISGLAVLGSLVYLSLQVRQTERNQKALMNQGAVTRASEGMRWSGQQDISGLYARMQSGDNNFTAQEIWQLSLSLRSLLINNQDVFVQHKAGLVDQITFDTITFGMRGLLALPANRALWKSIRTSFAGEWTAFVDKLIEETPPAQPVDSVARFKANLA